MAGSGQERKDKPRFKANPFQATLTLRQPISFGRCIVLCLGFLLLAFIIALAAGGAYITNRPGDYFFMIDQGWRLAQGQLPYRDFLTPIGPLYYALIGAMGVITGGDPTAYRLTGFLALLLFGPGLIWISWRRLPGSLAVFIAIAFLMIPISPRELDGSYIDSEFLALYNTLSWPLMATLLLGALFRARDPEQRSHGKIDGFAIGLALCGLLSLKLTHGLLGCGVLVSGFLIRPGNRTALLIASATMLGALIIAIIAAGDILAAHLANLLAIGAANDFHERIDVKLVAFFRANIATALMTLFTLWVIELYRQHHPEKVNLRDLLAALVISGAAYLEAFNDHENTPAAISLLFALFWLISRNGALPTGEMLARLPRGIKAALPALPLLIWAGLPLAKDSAAIVLHSINARTKPANTWPADLTGSASNVANLKIASYVNEADTKPLSEIDFATAYVRSLREGIAELRDLHLGQANIYEVRFNSSLNWLMQAPSPRHVLAWLDVGRTFSQDHHPAAETYLKDVDVLMISTLDEEEPRVTLFEQVYGAIVDRDFELVRTTECWRIYRRRFF